MLADFARRAAEEFARDAPVVAEGPPMLPAADPVPLSAHGLFRAVVRAQFVRVAAWFGVGAGERG